MEIDRVDQRPIDIEDRGFRQYALLLIVPLRGMGAMVCRRKGLATPSSGIAMLVARSMVQKHDQDDQRDGDS